MTYETPEIQEIGNADELTLGGGFFDNVDGEDCYRKPPIQF